MYAADLRISAVKVERGHHSAPFERRKSKGGITAGSSQYRAGLHGVEHVLFVGQYAASCGALPELFAAPDAAPCRFPEED